MDTDKNNEINIELSEDVAQGTYANLAIISHSTSEFVLDFVRLMPGLIKAKVQSRIILTPEHAKRLLTALQDNLLKYESTYGKVKTNTGIGMPPIPMMFGNNTAQA
ncbi:MAG: DUF3467 domain-containing protein [Prevotellaceae bacterium]|jgi:hypothetical protein|nr:DUF3467 domain-containing protein [Prevotellaceae bacterium]